jgi:hypothetical protein
VRSLVRWRVGGGHGRDLVECPAGVTITAKLQQLVFEPRERVEVAHRRPEILALCPLPRRIVRGAVRRGRVVPQPELQKHMRGHVQCVAGAAGNARVRPSGLERQARVAWVVVSVQEVVQRPLMLRVRFEDFSQNRGDLRLSRASRQLTVRRLTDLRVSDQAARHGAE